MPKKKSKSRLNKKLKMERAALKLLRSNLGLRSFHIFNVAKSRCKHKSDFIAWPKYSSANVYLIQLNEKRGIQIRPFGLPYLTPNVRSAIESTKKSCPVRIQKEPPIRPAQRKLQIGHWLTPDAKEEMQTLTGIAP